MHNFEHNYGVNNWELIWHFESVIDIQFHAQGTLIVQSATLI